MEREGLIGFIVCEENLSCYLISGCKKELIGRDQHYGDRFAKRVLALREKRHRECLKKVSIKIGYQVV